MTDDPSIWEPTFLAFAGLAIHAHHPERLARFWGEVLGGSVHEMFGGWIAYPPEVDGYSLTFYPSEVPKQGQNRIHLDLTSESADAMKATIDRALAAGGRRIDIGQTEQDGHEVLADPEGNEFCVIEPGNQFLADTGTIGAINCDGTRELGYFWSQALGWPLVWDQDQETAIQSPSGGTKITWSGPPLMPRHGRERLHFEMASSYPHEATSHLLALGATSNPSQTVLLDPDGNEFEIIEG